MSDTEENYLDNLLKAVSEPQEAATMDGEQADQTVEDKLGASFGMPEEPIPKITDAEEIPPDEPIVLEEEPEEAVVDATAVEEETLPEPEMSEEKMVEELPEPETSEEKMLEELPEPEISEAELSVPPETESEEDLFADLMKDNPIAEKMSESNAQEDDFSISDIENPVSDISMEEPEIKLDNADELQPEPEEIDESVPESEPASTEAEEPAQSVELQEKQMQEMETEPASEEQAIPESEPVLEDTAAISEDTPQMSDEQNAEDAETDMSDILEMMDDDPDIAEINDMLKKSDNKEPVQEDDVMELLNQMADEEDKEDKEDVETSDATETSKAEETVSASTQTNDAEEVETPKKKKRVKKAKVKEPKEPRKAAKNSETEGDAEKKPGVLNKIYHLLTDEWEPEPTEEELAQKAQEAAAAKAEADSKKEEEKKEKDEAKKTKAAEKEAAKKAKAEAAAQKKKEKQEAKEAKLAEKRAKEEAEAPKNQKRLSPKKIAVVTVFAASVLAGILLFSNYASVQSSLVRARRAYYSGDYKSVYVETYGEKLDESDSLIEGKSKVILTMQRKLDSYQNHLKLGQNVEALNALITGLQTYDAINLDAETYGVLTEVDSIKEEILNILSSNYGLNEEEAKALLQEKDQVAYTLALEHIINGSSNVLVKKDM